MTFLQRIFWMFASVNYILFDLSIADIQQYYIMHSDCFIFTAASMSVCVCNNSLQFEHYKR